MALIMYFTRAPRHEGVTAKDIKLMESYFEWQHEIEVGSKYASKTFEKWCGHSEDELPDKKIMEYYKYFYTLKERYTEGIGNENVYSIFEQLNRYANTNEVFNWFVTNVMSANPDDEYHEVTKTQLERFLNDCKEVQKGFVHTGKNWLNVDEYNVDIDLARKFLPMVPEKPYWCDDKAYGTRYTMIVLDAIKNTESILATTDFTKQAVYVNAFLCKV